MEFIHTLKSLNCIHTLDHVTTQPPDTHTHTYNHIHTRMHTHVHTHMLNPCSEADLTCPLECDWDCKGWSNAHDIGRHPDHSVALECPQYWQPQSIGHGPPCHDHCCCSVTYLTCVTCNSNITVTCSVLHLHRVTCNSNITVTCSVLHLHRVTCNSNITVTHSNV